MNINVSLTNPRHISAAHAAWKRAAEGATLTEFVQRALEREADAWVESTRVDQISVFAFVQRFTAAEFAAITASADPNVAVILATLRARDSVRLGSVDAVQGVGYLVSAGFLTAERGAEVLHYDLPQAP